MRTHCSFRVRLPVYTTLISSALTLVACSEATVPIVPTKYTVTVFKATQAVTTAAVGDTILVKAQLVDANDHPVSKINQRLSWYSTSGTDGHFMSPASSTDNQGSATNYFIFGTKAGITEDLGVIDQNRLTGNSPTISVTAGVPSQYIVKVGTSTPYVGTTLNVRAQLTDKFGNPSNIAGRVVTWSVVDNGGGGYSYEKGVRANRLVDNSVRANRLVAPSRARASTSAGTFSSPTSTTDNQGVATVDFIVGTTIGNNFTIAASDDQKVSGQTVVVAVLAGPPAKFVVTASVTDPPAGALVLLTASATDAYGNFVNGAGIALNWSVTGTDATLTSTVTSTNSGGIAANQLRTGSVPGTSYTVSVATTGSFQATGTSPTITTQEAVALASLASGFGSATSCGIATNGAVWCWGEEDNGMVPSRPVPGKPVGDLAMSSLSTSDSYTCGISAGTVMCWGMDDAGQLGDNSRTNRTTPAPINSSLSFSAVTTGSAHSCALATSGDIYCWGNPGSGRLGDGTGFTSLGPIKVAGGFSFTALSAGRAHTCAIATTGAVYCWGSNAQGQLGDGTFFDRPTPTLVSGGLSFTVIAAGDSHTCGISNGAIYCWGDNIFGETGSGALPQSVVVPTAVKTLGTFTSVAAGGFHSCAIASNSTAWCWGDNTGRELGDPAYTQSFAQVPIAVTGGLTFKSIAVGGSGSNTGDYYYGPYATGHSCGITTDGSTYCWGDNASGNLGTGTFGIPNGTPTKVSGQK